MVFCVRRCVAPEREDAFWLDLIKVSMAKVQKIDLNIIKIQIPASPRLLVPSFAHRLTGILNDKSVNLIHDIAP